jgi:hypothetical protein
MQKTSVDSKCKTTLEEKVVAAFDLPVDSSYEQALILGND